MPWCLECERFLTPPTVRPDGTCPACGRPVEATAPRRAPVPSAGPGGVSPAHAPVEPTDLPPVPWHLKLLVGSLVVYLGYRAFQGVEWVVHTLSR